MSGGLVGDNAGYHTDASHLRQRDVFGILRPQVKVKVVVGVLA